MTLFFKKIAVLGHRKIFHVNFKTFNRKPFKQSLVITLQKKNVCQFFYGLYCQLLLFFFNL